MNSLPLSKRVLQQLINPLLRDTLQKRFVILHEIISAQELAFKLFLSRLDAFLLLDVTLTFDDGFRSSCEAIRSLHDRKAMFFVCPGFTNTAGDSFAAEAFFRNNLLRTESLASLELREAVLPASWDDLRELVKLGHTIGSHTMNHARLSKIISSKELEYEIIGSADMIEDRLNVKVDTMAYPFGDIASISERAYKIIEKRYTRCLAGVRGNNYNSQNPHLVWRDAVDPLWPQDYVEFVLRGGLDWYYVFKRKKLRAITL